MSLALLIGARLEIVYRNVHPFILAYKLWRQTLLCLWSDLFRDYDYLINNSFCNMTVYPKNPTDPILRTQFNFIKGWSINFIRDGTLLSSLYVSHFPVFLSSNSLFPTVLVSWGYCNKLQTWWLNKTKIALV